MEYAWPNSHCGMARNPNVYTVSPEVTQRVYLLFGSLTLMGQCEVRTLGMLLSRRGQFSEFRCAHMTDAIFVHHNVACSHAIQCKRHADFPDYTAARCTATF